MAILFLETTFESSFSIIVLDNNRVFLNSNKTNKKQSEVIADITKKNLEEADISPINLKAIYVTNGPGNFTSIRVGLAFAQGLTKGLSIPLYSTSALEFLVSDLVNKDIKTEFLLPIIPSRGEDFFVQVFNSKTGKNKSEIEKLALKDVIDRYMSEKFTIVKLMPIPSLDEIIGKEAIVDNNLSDKCLAIATKIRNKTLKPVKKLRANYYSPPSADEADPKWYMVKKR